MTHILDKSALLLLEDPTKIYYRWNGLYYADDNNLCRYDKMTFNLVYMHKGRGVFRQCPVVQSKNKDSEPLLIASTESVVRILSGERRNRVVLSDDLFHDESSKAAGIYKYLTIGRTSTTFSENPDRPELTIRDELKELCEEPIHSCNHYQSMVIPRFFITCKDDNTKVIKPRKGSNFAKSFHNLVPFDIDASDVDRVDAGNGRVGFDFGDVHGKGVVAGDPKECGKWNCIKTTPSHRNQCYVYLEHADIEVYIDL